MPAPQRTHRASAQRRRDSLLAAAAELSAELGAGAVTHRAVAARAGVPLSTTSYFFTSIDELVTEALRVGTTDRFERLRQTEQAAVERLDVSAHEAIRAAVDQAAAVSTDRTIDGDQIEFFLAAGRNADLRAEAVALVDEFVGLLRQQFEELGAPQAEAAAWTIAAFGDGAMVHRFAQLHDDHPDRLAGALRLLVAAAMLTDEEIEGALGRYDAATATATATAAATAS